MNIGDLVSRISTGLLRHPGSDRCMIPSSPSPRACPPNPTASLVASSHASPLRGLTPRPIIELTSPPEHAGTRSGMPCASAFSTTSPPSSPVHRVKVGMGGTACITDPGSVTTRIGRKFPATTEVSGVVSALKMRLQKASVWPTGRLMGPFTSRSLPVQSMTISSSVIVTVTCILIKRSRSTPSLSTKSWAVQVPLGSLARARRASFSPWSLIASIAPRRVSAPYLAAISWVRRTPVTQAETCAWMSPMVRSGIRLLKRMMLKMSSFWTPPR